MIKKISGYLRKDKRLWIFGFLIACIVGSFVFAEEPDDIPFKQGKAQKDLVDTSNGALKLTYKDFSIPAGGPYLSLLRYYDSQSLYNNGIFGRGWHSNIDLVFRYRPKEIKNVEELIFDQNGNFIGTSSNIIETKEKIEITEATGWINIFEEKDGTVSSIHGELDKIQRINNEFIRTTSNGDKYYFTQPVLEEDIPIPSDQQREWIEGNQKHIEITKYSISSALNFKKRGLYRLSKIETKDGNTLIFKYSGNSFSVAYSSFPNKKLTFTYNPMGKIAKAEDFTGRQWIYSYDSKGNLISTRNPENIITRFEYDFLNNLTKIIASKERITQIAYNLDDMVISVTYPTGAKMEYLYETIPGRGLVTTIIDPLGAKTTHSYEPGYYEDKERLVITTDKEGNIWKKYRDSRKNVIKEIDPNGGITLYSYDERGNVIKKTDAMGNVWQWEYNQENLLLKSTAPNGATFEFIYNGGNLIQIKDHYGKIAKREYANGQITKKIDENNNAIIYEYDSNGNLSKERDPSGNETTYTYDSLGNKLSMKDANGNTTNYNYDSMNRLIRITHPDGTSKQYVYDCCDLVETIDENGKSTRYEYDFLGMVIEEIDALAKKKNYTYNKNGDLIKKRDSNGNSWSFTYNNIGRMTSLCDPIGNTVRYEYDGVSNRIKETDAIGRITTYTYDKLNRLLDMKIDNTEVGKYTYDNVGNRLSMEDGDGKITYFKYDLLNRVISKTTPGGEITSFFYDDASNLTKSESSYGVFLTFTYDKNNRVKEIKDENGKIVEAYTYNKIGKILSKREAKGTTSYGYDSRNRIIEVKSSNGESSHYTYDSVGNIITNTNREGAITRYLYDSLNRLSSITDPLGNRTYVTRDDVGRVISITDSNGNTSGFEYDSANRKIKETYADGTSKLFTYDGGGRMTSLKDQNGDLIEFSYNFLNQISKKKYPDGSEAIFEYDKTGKMTKAVNNNGYIQSTYDNDGNLTSEDQNGKKITYTYDMANQKRTITYPSGKIVTEEYNKKGRLLNVIAEGQSIATYTYNEDRLSERAYLNNVKTTFGYDGVNRLNSLLCTIGTLTIFNYNYDYNKEDNKKYIKALHNGSLSETYAYDGNQRLTNFKQGDLQGENIPSPINEISYILDGVGNWLSKNNEQIIHNNVNEYTLMGTKTLVYDKNGRLIDDGKNIYSYDYENQLTGVKRKFDGFILAKYRYDAVGRRIEKETTFTTTYIYDQTRLIEEWSGGTATAIYIYGAGIDEIIAMKRGTQTYYYHHNDLGNVTALTDPNGVVVERYSYDPYGGPRIFDGNGSLTEKSLVGNSFLFTGKFLDIETGFYYFRARYYSPQMGRFITRDPSGYTEGLNLYQYVLSNPINRIDPTGLLSFSVSSERWVRWLPEKLKKFAPQGGISVSYGREEKCCESGPHEGEYVTDWSLAVGANISWTIREIPVPGLSFMVPIVNIGVGLKITIGVSVSGELSGGSDKCNNAYQGEGCITGGGSINADFGGGIGIAEAYIGGGISVTIKICLTASVEGACLSGNLCAGGEIYAKISFNIWITSWEFLHTFLEIGRCWEVFKKCI